MALGSLRFRSWMLPLALAVLVGVIGWWAQTTMDRTLKRNLADGLQTIIEADVTALRVWLQAEEAATARLAAIPDVTASALALDEAVRRSEAALETLHADPNLSRLRRILGGSAAANEDAGFVLLDRTGRVIGADFDAALGYTLAPGDAAKLVGILDGSQSLLGPVLFPSSGSDSDTGSPVPAIFIGAPVVDPAGRSPLVLARRFSPSGDFTRILQVARFGASGQTYAFNANGVVISELRDPDALRRMGLLPDEPGAQPILTLALRDPGVDLTAGASPRSPTAGRPWTRLAQAALTETSEGSGGVDVAGYRDFRGVLVVGAWRWVAPYDFGVATEVDAEEAFQTLYIVRRAFWSLVALLVIGAVGALVYSRLFTNLQRRVEQAEKLGQYTLEEKIGEGGMGTVYRARHAMLARPTAIKLLRSGETSTQLVARFEREVQLTSQLTNPNTIAIYDYGRTPEGVFYYAMEYLDGITLDNLVEIDGPQPEGRVVHILRQLAGSLAEAHDIGLIHRDIKPANIMLLERGGAYDVVKVLDFGLVREIHQAEDQMLTAVNTIPGTPHFLAPEAIESPETIDARSDLYAVGAVAYYLLTGTYVFEAASVIQLMTRHLNDLPEPPSARLGRPVDPALERLILQLLEKNPATRPANGRALLDTLDNGFRLESPAWTATDARQWWETRSTPCRLPGCLDDESFDSALEIDLEDRVIVS